MKGTILMVSFIVAIAACGQPEKQVMEIEPAIKEVEPVVNPERFAIVSMQLAQLVDPTTSSSSDLGKLFNCYLITEKGEVNEVPYSTAIAKYIGIVDGVIDPVSQAPVFEVKGSDHVLLLVKEKNIWANILLDKASMTIQDISFPTGSAVAKLGTKAPIFRGQFAGSTVNFAPKNFELTPWEADPADGAIQIDGVAGATKICQASVDMLNNQLPFYRSYLELSKQ